VLAGCAAGIEHVEFGDTAGDGAHRRTLVGRIAHVVRGGVRVAGRELGIVVQAAGHASAPGAASFLQDRFPVENELAALVDDARLASQTAFSGISSTTTDVALRVSPMKTGRRKCSVCETYKPPGA